VVFGPTGTSLGEALCRDEGILYAEIDLAQSVEPKQFHDVVGSYNRFDIFTLSVDRSARLPATFIDGDKKGEQHLESGSMSEVSGTRAGSDGGK
jgi:aliphatic nitrilase